MALGRPWRSLRFRLIVLLMLCVIGVLAGANAIEIRRATRLAQQNLQEEAFHVARQVDVVLAPHYGRADFRDFHHRLAQLARTHHSVASVELLVPVGGRWRVFSRNGQARLAEPSALDRLAMELNRPIWQLLPGGSHLGLAVAPFHVGRRVIGAIRVTASLAEVERLAKAQANRALMLTLISVIAIAAILGLVLTRTFVRPVRLLVRAMNAARAGRLDTRVQLRSSAELEQLGDHFNRMLETIDQADHKNRALVEQLSRFNEELETRVRAATEDIAAKNLELQRINEQLWHVQKQLGQAERLAALGQMTAAIAHELGTPLNSVLGYTQLLQKEVASKEGRDKLAIIESQVRVMSHAIRKALDQTRTPSLERRDVAVRPLIENTLALLNPVLQAKRIVVDRDLAAAPEHIAADPHALQQVLMNLLTNAVDALDQGGHITILATSITENGGPPGLRLCVTDNGRGISPRDLDSVFQPFFTTKAAGRGTGLGLTITQDVARAHGGTVEVRSRLGEGTSVAITIAGGAEP